MMKLLILSCVLSACVFVSAEDSFQECLNKDSITCVQMAIFRKARDFFDQPQISLIGGLSFVKAAQRDARQFHVDTTGIEQARNVESREEQLENYFVERAKNFVQERSLNFDMATAARSISNAIPDDVKASVRSLVVEARGKKKILKSLLPILGLVKLIKVKLAILALFGIALIAKKALLVSLIALVLSKFLFIKKLLSKGKEESGHSSGGWGGHESFSSYGDYGSHSQPAHSIAYSGHKQVRK